MRLKEAAGWNQTEADWLRLLRLEPDGCFAAIQEGRLVGTTTTTTYENDLAWVGMVLVDPESRRQGIASKLMETALDYLKDKVATVKLDATPAGKLVYEKFGFEVESMVERWSGNVISSSIDRNPEILNVRLSLNARTREELLALDERAFDADRSKLIKSLIDDALVPPVFQRSENGKLSGYALARRGTNASYIGPVVATEPAAVEGLVDQLLRQMSGRLVYVDFNCECSSQRNVLSDRGFVKDRDLIRMSSGAGRKKTSSFVFGIAGPEIG
jgi:GNAT superfamily N-acetyltransferase